MTDILSGNEIQPCLPGQVVVNLGADVWVSWPNGSAHTGAMIGVCSKRCMPGNPIAVVTVGRVPYDAYNLGAGNESSIIAGNFPSRGTGGTVIGTADPAGEITVLPSYVGQGVPFSPTPGTAGQFFMTNAVPATAWVSLSGDASAGGGSQTGVITVTGIQGKPFSNVAPSTNWVPVYNGSAWVPQALTASQLPNLAGDVIGNPNTTIVANITGVSGNTNLNANFVALRDNALQMGSSNSRLRGVVAQVFAAYNAANDARPTVSITGAQTSYGAGGGVPQDLRTYRSGVSELTVDNSGGANANLVVTGKSALQGASSDYTAYGNAPGTSGYIRVTPNANVISANGSTVLKLDANSNATLNGAKQLDLQINGTSQLTATANKTNFTPNGSTAATLNSSVFAISPSLGGLSNSVPLTYEVNTMTNLATANASATFNVNANCPVQLFNGHVGPNAVVNVVFPQIRTYYLIDAANMAMDTTNVNVNFMTGTGSKVLNWTPASSSQRFLLYVDGSNSVYVSNFV